MSFPSMTVVNASVVKTMIPDAKRPGKRKPYIVGVRLDMADGSWWFRSSAKKNQPSTWTKHEPGLPVFYKSGTPTGEIGPERVTRFGTDDAFHRTMGHCKRLMDALSTAMATAA